MADTPLIHVWNRPLWTRLQARPGGLPSSILLSGPRGVGKRSFGQALAMAALCSERSPAGEACGKCRACELFAAGSHPDYRLLEPSSPELAESGPESPPVATANSSRVISVDRIRDLSGFLAMSPHYGQSKAVVIQPADKLHLSAANALLKTLEEPPPRTLLILVSDRPYQLLPTMVSRCYRIDFVLPSAQAGRTWLHDHGVKEPEIALAQSGFAPLAAEHLDDEIFWRKRRAINDLLGVPDLNANDLARAVSYDEVPAFWGFLYRWCYDLTALRAGGAVRYNPDYTKSLNLIAVNLDLRRLHNFMKELTAAGRALEHPLNPRLVSERLAIGYVRSVSNQEQECQ